MRLKDFCEREFAGRPLPHFDEVDIAPDLVPGGEGERAKAGLPCAILGGAP